GGLARGGDRAARNGGEDEVDARRQQRAGGLRRGGVNQRVDRQRAGGRQRGEPTAQAGQRRHQPGAVGVALGVGDARGGPEPQVGIGSQRVGDRLGDEGAEHPL